MFSIIALSAWAITGIAAAAVAATGGATYGGIRLRNHFRDKGALEAFKEDGRDGLHVYYIDKGMAKTDGQAERLVDAYMEALGVNTPKKSRSKRAETATA